APADLSRRTHAHALAHVGEDLGADRAGLVRAPREDALELALVGPQLAVALAHRRQVAHELLGERRLQIAVAPRVRQRDLDRAHARAADRRQDLEQVGDAGLVGRGVDVAAGVRHGALDLL